VSPTRIPLAFAEMVLDPIIKAEPANGISGSSRGRSQTQDHLLLPRALSLLANPLTNKAGLLHALASRFLPNRASILSLPTNKMLIFRKRIQRHFLNNLGHHFIQPLLSMLRTNRESLCLVNGKRDLILEMRINLLSTSAEPR